MKRSNQASLVAGQAAWDAMTPDDTGDDTRTECEIFGHDLELMDSAWVGGKEVIIYQCHICDHVEERKA